MLALEVAVFCYAGFIQQLDGGGGTEVCVAAPLAQSPYHFFLGAYLEHLDGSGPLGWIFEIRRAPVTDHGISISETTDLLKNEALNRGDVCARELPNDLPRIGHFDDHVGIR